MRPNGSNRRYGTLNPTAAAYTFFTSIHTGTLVNYGWEYKLVQPLWEKVWRFLKKLKIELPYDPAIPLLGIYWKKKTLIRKHICTPIFIAALFTKDKIWK